MTTRSKRVKDYFVQCTSINRFEVIHKRHCGLYKISTDHDNSTEDMKEKKQPNTTPKTNVLDSKVSCNDDENLSLPKNSPIPIFGRIRIVHSNTDGIFFVHVEDSKGLGFHVSIYMRYLHIYLCHNTHGWVSPTMMLVSGGGAYTYIMVSECSPVRH